jgi:hypothetical protein
VSSALLEHDDDGDDDSNDDDDDDFGQHPRSIEYTNTHTHTHTHTMPSRFSCHCQVCFFLHSGVTYYTYNISCIVSVAVFTKTVLRITK